MYMYMCVERRSLIAYNNTVRVPPLSTSLLPKLARSFVRLGLILKNCSALEACCSYRTTMRLADKTTAACDWLQCRGWLAWRSNIAPSCLPNAPLVFQAIESRRGNFHEARQTKTAAAHVTALNPRWIITQRA